MTSAGIMPRLVAAWALTLAACSFSADYGRGHYACSDGKCPSGLVCSAQQECVLPGDAMGGDGKMPDAPRAALTCTDPGLFPSGSGSDSYNTSQSSNHIGAMCGGFVMNGFDRVYRVDTGAAQHIKVSVSGDFMVNVYVIAPCSIVPAVPSCESNMLASPGNPIDVVTQFAGQHFVIIDSSNAASMGTYSMTVQVTP